MIRLELERNDKEHSVIALSEDYPAMDYIDGEVLLLENNRYTLSLQCGEELQSAGLMIGDSFFDMSYHKEQGEYRIDDKMVFEGYYDLIRITVVLTDFMDREQVLFSPCLRVASSKQTIAKINEMLAEVENAYPQILHFCFHDNYKEASQNKNHNRTIWNTITILDEIISVYNTNLSLFSNYCNSKVDDIDRIVDAHAMRNMNQSSLNFIVTNPNNLLDTTRERKGFQIGKKFYLPQRVCIPVNERHTGTYENRVIVGFLKKLQLYLDDTILKLEWEIEKANDIPQKIIDKLPDTHDLTGRCIQVRYRMLVDKLKKRRKSISEAYYSYQRVLGCDELVINNAPKLTNVFKQVKQYRLCYEYMLKWFEEGAYSLEAMDYVFHLKKLSKIFEYLCLLRLQDALCQKGYQLMDAKRVDYAIDDDFEKTDGIGDDQSASINNKYEFRNDKYRVLLYYEPYLCCDKCHDEIEVYSTGFNFEKEKWSPYWKPDYLLKIEGEQQSYYYVLDAKFSNYSTIKKHHMKSLALKYGVQLATKDKHFSHVLGVGALYLDGRRNTDYFKKNINNVASFPLYFSIDIREREESTLENALGELIEQMEQVGRCVI